MRISILVLLLASLLGGASAFAKPVGFDFGLQLGSAATNDEFDDTVAGVYLGGYADLNAWLLKAKGQILAMKYQENDFTYEVSGNGTVLFGIQLHEVMVRSYAPRGTNGHIAAGLGGGGSIGGKDLNLALSLSAGAIALRWTAIPAENYYDDSLITGVGAYVGAVMKVKVYRLKNEMRIAICRTTNFDSIGSDTDWGAVAERLYTNPKKCAVASGEHEFELIKIPFAKIAPELRWRYEDLPREYESPEMVLTVGAKAYIDL